MFTHGHSQVISLASVIPDERITSTELLDEIDSFNRFGIKNNWLERTTGIQERRRSPSHIQPSDLASDAAQIALDKAGLLASNIDIIIFTGVTRDHSIEPSTAHHVQHKIKAVNATAFDVNNACLGFMTGIYIMDALIFSGQVRYGLVVTGEKGFSFTQRAMDKLKTSNDRKYFDDLAAGLTLGDAGAAMVLAAKKSPDTGFMGFEFSSKGEHASMCYCGDMMSTGALVTDMTNIFKAGQKLSIEVYTRLIKEQLQWSNDDISLYVPHQVGKATFKIANKITGLPLNKMPITVTTLGNLVSASIPVSLDTREKQSGDKIFLAGAGSGLCAGHAGLIWG